MKFEFSVLDRIAIPVEPTVRPGKHGRTWFDYALTDEGAVDYQARTVYGVRVWRHLSAIRELEKFEAAYAVFHPRPVADVYRHAALRAVLRAAEQGTSRIVSGDPIDWVLAGAVRSYKKADGSYEGAGYYHDFDAAGGSLVTVWDIGHCTIDLAAIRNQLAAQEEWQRQRDVAFGE